MLDLFAIRSFVTRHAPIISKTLEHRERVASRNVEKVHARWGDRSAVAVPRATHMARVAAWLRPMYPSMVEYINYILPATGADSNEIACVMYLLDPSKEREKCIQSPSDRRGLVQVMTTTMWNSDGASEFFSQ